MHQLMQVNNCLFPIPGKSIFTTCTCCSNAYFDNTIHLLSNQYSLLKKTVTIMQICHWLDQSYIIYMFDHIQFSNPIIVHNFAPNTYLGKVVNTYLLVLLIAKLTNNGKLGLTTPRTCTNCNSQFGNSWNSIVAQ